MNADLMDVAALGRPFTLGMLYDARKDKLIPGLTLWTDDILQEKTTVTPQHSSAFEVSTSDSIESKTHMLNVEASLKASFLSGLIEIEGSAKYLKDEKKFKNQSRVTCQYKATTTFEQLSMVDLVDVKPNQMNVIEKGLATHVVTGIVYGANAFFVFDSEKVDDSKVQEIQGSMKAMIKKIPTFDFEASVDIKLTDEEKSLSESCSCKFYGDFILESNPASYQDAVKTYAQLPKLLGEDGKNAVPMKVWLMPLKNLFPQAAQLKSEISIKLVRKAQDALEDLREAQMRCNDSLQEKVVEKFPYIQEELTTYQKLCSQYASNLQLAMEKRFPSIRDGAEDESSALQLFEDREKSPFSREKLSKWLDHKEREINIVKSSVDIMEGTKIVLTQSQLDREVLAPGVSDALCFVFTSMERGDASLDQMAEYLDSSKLGSTEEDQWYFSPEVLTKLREKAKMFHELAEAQKKNSNIHFLIATITNKKYKGATIYHYKNGILVTEDFSKPDLPPHNVTDRRDLLWYACDLNLDPNTVNGYIVLSDGDKRASTGPTWYYYPDHPDRFDSHTQVMCKESLSGRHYWEVEWSHESGQKKSIYAAVAYKGMERKGGGSDSSLGSNPVSWTFGKYEDSKDEFRAWHNGYFSTVPLRESKKLGVYLDWSAGTLSFYNVSANTLTHLHTFYTRFTEPVCPGFWAYNNFNYVYLCPFE